MKKGWQKALLSLSILLLLITMWNLSVLFLIPPQSFSFTDSEGKLCRIESRVYLFNIRESRDFVEDVYMHKCITLTFGKTAILSTYDADGRLMDREIVDLTK